MSRPVLLLVLMNMEKEGNLLNYAIALCGQDAQENEQGEIVALFLRPQGGIVLDVGARPGEAGVRVVTTRQFRDNFFALMREVRETGCEVVVTNRGKPYARIAREIERSGGIVGCDKDILRIVGDLPESITPAEELYSVTDPERVLDGETDWC